MISFKEYINKNQQKFNIGDIFENVGQLYEVIEVKNKNTIVVRHTDFPNLIYTVKVKTDKIGPYAVVPVPTKPTKSKFDFFDILSTKHTMYIRLRKNK